MWLSDPLRLSFRLLSASFIEICYVFQKVTQVAGVLNTRYMNELYPKSLQVFLVGLVFLCCCQRSLICHTKNQNWDRIHGTTKFGQVYFHELLQNHNDHRPMTKKACHRGRKIHNEQTQWVKQYILLSKAQRSTFHVQSNIYTIYSRFIFYHQLV